MVNLIFKAICLISITCFVGCIPATGPGSTSSSSESIQPGSISTTSNPNNTSNTDLDSKPGPKGNAEGIEGRRVLRFANALSRCEFSQINQTSSFNIDCFASILDEKNTLVPAEVISGVELEWRAPKLLEGSEITASNCSETLATLSYHCTLTLDSVSPTLLQFDLNVVETGTKAQKLRSNVVVLPRIAAFQESLNELIGTHTGDSLFPTEMDFNKDGQITEEDIRILGLYPNLDVSTDGISANEMMGKLVSNCRLRINTGLGHPSYFKACDIDLNSYITVGNDVGRLRVELKALLPPP